jgi:hypothetical protein
VLLDVCQTGLGVDEDDLLGALAQGEDAGHLADGTSAEDGDGVVGVDGGVLDGVVGCGQDVGKVETLKCCQ